MTKQIDIERLIRPGLLNISPYQPVEPSEILGKRTGIDVKKIVKLDANENPYGCSKRVKQALADYPYFSLYPDPEQRDLRQALGKFTGFNVENILAGSGSDELIELILRLFLEPGDKVISCPPTFGMYKFCTQMCLGKLIEIARKSDFTLDIDLIEKSIDKNTKVIFIASPNNPTGNVVERSIILQLLSYEIVVVVDEAYAEFSSESLVDLVPNNSNLIVLRTFSKWAGLAGLRVGYGIFPAFIVTQLMKIKQPYNVNAAAQVAAIESLNEIRYLEETIAKIKKERDRLYNKLKAIKWITPFNSQANFILCRIQEKEAISVYQQLQKKGIFIRYYDNEELKNYIRVSVGRPEHTHKLIAALKEI